MDGRMTAVPEDALLDAVRAYKALERAIDADDPDGFRREVELANLRLRGICIRMGWSK